MSQKKIDELIRFYRKRQASIRDKLAIQVGTRSANYTRTLERQITAEINALDRYAARWGADVFAANYAASMSGAYAALSVAVPADITARSRFATRVILSNFVGDMTEAHHFLGRRINDVFRQASIDAVTAKIIEGETVRQAKDHLVKLLSDQGLVAFTDSAGREISLDAYASMVARTTTREATNLGTIQACREIGNDLVQISDHGTACDLCAPFEGRVYSISGEDRRYPALDMMFSGGFSTIHPNCKHVVTPYIESLDRNAEARREYSNRPFDIDPRTEQQRRDYEASQHRNRQIRADRNQHERYRLALGDDAPKTFASFRNIKNNHPDRFQELQNQYRAVRRTAG